MSERQAADGRRDRRRAKSCENCDAEARPLARLTRASPAAGTITIMVCRYCYLRLGGTRKRQGGD